MTMTLRANILIAGKTGVGKSTFINYIYGENIAQTGAGKPVTGYRLHKYTYEENGVLYSIYDTWGLEADKAAQWEELIMDEVKKRDDNLSIKDWFHTIFYCFSATTARIESFEIDNILKPLIASGNNVCIIFTHADVPHAKEKIAAMREVLLEKVSPHLSMINVSSERKVLLGGTVVEPFGKQLVWDYVKHSLWRDLKRKLPLQVESFTLQRLDESYNEMENIISRYKHWSRRSILQRIERELKEKWELLVTDIVTALDELMQEAIVYYFKLMGRLLKVDDIKVNVILEQVKEQYKTGKGILEHNYLFMLLIERYPLVEGIVKLIQNHFVRKKLNERIAAKYVHFKTKIIPEIVEHYVEQIDRFEQQLLLMEPER